MLLFCRKITFVNRDVLKQRGPLLLALNHPNSFFDAMLIGSHFKGPVFFLTRGDAFRNPLVKKILTVLKMVPIYRLTEGREYLALNDATFDRCREILLNDGIVLIFAEGLCKNQWRLRSLKKGAARIALDAWSQPSMAERFRIQPVSLNYDSFNRFGKRIVIHFAGPIQKPDWTMQCSEGEKLKELNHLLSRKLSDGMIQAEDRMNWAPFLIRNHRIYKGPADQLVEHLKSKQEFLSKQSLDKPERRVPYLLAKNTALFVVSLIVVLLFAPVALIGLLLNAPLFFPLRNFVKAKTSGTVFYDSVLFGSLMVTYPLYWLVINFIGFFFTEKNYIHLVLLTMPLFAWLLLIYKDNFEKARHFLSLSADEKRVLDFANGSYVDPTD